ncbi:MAG: pyridoxal phosphate-dependent aminotransferase [Arenicellales bacterium WSBS_2016_MAG_OTU3]
MPGPRYTKLIESLPATVPFVGPETQERAMGRPFLARLGANENVFGASPKAIAAMQAAANEIWKYADPENFELKQALAKHHSIEPENIVIGEGIDGLLGYLVRMLINEGTKVVTSMGAYPTFNYHVSGFGGELCKVPYKEDKEDPDALLQKADETNTPLIYFANPDNPMGTWHSADKVQSMMDNIPDGSLLCLDEAYIEFAPANTAPEIDVNNAKVIRFRTFSKAYGMAGVRIGYGIAEAGLAAAFNKVRNHFGVNGVALAGALAALQDHDYLTELQNKVAKARNRIADIANKNGLQAIPSATNFVAIDCGKDGDYAKSVLNRLVAKGLFVRMPFVQPQNRCIRISVGTDSDLDVFEQCLPQAL